MAKGIELAPSAENKGGFKGDRPGQSPQGLHKIKVFYSEKRLRNQLRKQITWYLVILDFCLFGSNLNIT